MRYLTLMVLLLAGCAEQPFWHKVYPDLTVNHPVKIAVVSNPGFWCRSPDGAVACAQRDIQHDECSILVTADNAGNKCVIEHERLHCMGYEHANFSFSSPSCESPVEVHR